MTIKQQGGIFGRNPTFNEVDVDSNLNVSGDASVDGKLGVGGSNSILGFYVEKNNGSGYIGGFRMDNSSPFLTVQTTGGITHLQGINSSFTDVAAFGLQPSGGNINVGAGNFVMTSGYGIDFSATAGTGTSELFDDYEEGTWTASVTGSTAAPTTPNALTSKYTKVGRQVTINMPLAFVDLTGATGSLKVTGLPFSASTTNGSGLGSVILFNIQYNAGAGNTFVTALASGTEIFFYSMLNGDSYSSPDVSAGVNRIVSVAMTYMVD